MPRGVYPRTEEHNKHISESKKGQRKGISPWNKGKKCPQISQALKGKPSSKKGKPSGQIPWNKGIPFLEGKSNPNWKGGVSHISNRIRESSKYSEWRASIFERDNYICMECGKVGKGDLNAHHIKPFHIILKEHNIKNIDDAMSCLELWDPENGITLCEKCHDKKPRGKYKY